MPPVVSKTTQRLYDRLPETYRVLDTAAAGDYPLLRYLSVLVDEAGAVETILDRIDYLDPAEIAAAGDLAPPDAGSSALADPVLADVAWLPWLAQLVGTRLSGDLSEAGRRAAIADASGGWQAGTRAGIAAAAAQALTGTRYVNLTDHYGGSPWGIGISTTPIETPSPGAVLAAIARAHAKPAGVLLTHTYYAASWATIEAGLPTWADREAAGSWSAIESTLP